MTKRSASLTIMDFAENNKQFEKLKIYENKHGQQHKPLLAKDPASKLTA